MKTEVVQTPGRSSRATISSVYTDMDGYINGYLNAQEQALYNANRAKGLLCIANAKTAIDLTKARYVNTSSVMHNGNGDAFRHAVWNFGMTIEALLQIEI